MVHRIQKHVQTISLTLQIMKMALQNLQKSYSIKSANQIPIGFMSTLIGTNYWVLVK